MTWWGQTNTGRQWAAERSWSFVKIWRQTNKQTNKQQEEEKEEEEAEAEEGEEEGEEEEKEEEEKVIYISETPCELSQVA